MLRLYTFKRGFWGLYIQLEPKRMIGVSKLLCTAPVAFGSSACCAGPRNSPRGLRPAVVEVGLGVGCWSLPKHSMQGVGKKVLEQKQRQKHPHQAAERTFRLSAVC